MIRGELLDNGSGSSRVMPAFVLNGRISQLQSHIKQPLHHGGNFCKVVVTATQYGNVIEREASLDAFLEKRRRSSKVIDCLLANVQVFSQTLSIGFNVKVLNVFSVKVANRLLRINRKS